MNTLILCLGNKHGPGMGGASLQGCGADGWTIYNYVKKVCPPGTVNIVPLMDESNTSDGERAAIKAALAQLKPGEWLWIHLSGHGTTIAIQGQNHGAIVKYNSNWNDTDTFQLDSNYTYLFNQAPAGTKIFLTVDACEFGDSIRGIQPLIGTDRNEWPRYLQPPIAQQILIDQNTCNGAQHRSVTAALKNVCGIAGCQRGPGFTCADVRDASGAYGAFTHYLVDLLGKRLSSQIAADERMVLSQRSYEQQPVQFGQDWEWIAA